MRAAPFALASRPARSLGARLASRSTGIKVPFAREQPDEPPLPPDEEPPFRVYRSKMGNLPVYSDTRSGGSKVVTILRKFQGDVDSLSRSVSRLCKNDVQQFHGRIEVKGKHAGTLKKWLADLGF